MSSPVTVIQCSVYHLYNATEGMLCPFGLGWAIPDVNTFISVRSLHAGTGHACMSIQARYLSLSALPSGRMDWAHRWRDSGCSRNLRHGGSD